MAFADGICMGYGLGLACAAEFRVVTERSVLAMPECAIGISPDVGFSAMAALMALEGAPGVGRCMALTGWRLTGPEALATGLATHLVPSERLKALKDKLKDYEESKGESFRAHLVEALQQETLHIQEPGSAAAVRDVLRTTFAPSTTAKAIRERLGALSQDSGLGPEIKSWVEQRLSGFDQGCPLTQEVVQRLMDQAQSDVDRECQLHQDPENYRHSAH